MSFPDFLDASYALLAEERQRIEPFKTLLSVRDEVGKLEPRREGILKPTVAEQNDQNMQMLGSVMSGVRPKRPRNVK